MGFYTDAIRLIELSEEQLCISDLNVDDVAASLKGEIDPELQKGMQIPSCPANDVMMRLEALVEHCTSIAKKTCDINEMLNGHCRDRESVERIKREDLNAHIHGVISAQTIKSDRK